MTKIEQNQPLCPQTRNPQLVPLALWTLAWVLSTALLRFGAEYLWHYQASYSLLVFVTHLGFGAAMIKANIHYLANLDELQKKITMDAMGITLGVGLIAGLAYEQLEDIRLITFEPEINHLVMLMAVTYIISIVIGNRKYQ